MSEGTKSTRIASTRVGRGQRAWSQLWQVPTFCFGVVAFLCVAATTPFRADLREGPFATDLRALRQGIHDEAEPQELANQADRLLAQVLRYPRREGEALFLAGSAYARLAETAPTDSAARAKALDCLEKALTIGVPEADVPALHHRLGVTLYHRGDDLPRAVQLMAESVEQGADDPRQSYGLLVEAQLKLPTPDVDAALTASQKLLELAESPAALGKTRYLRAELFLRKDQRHEALKELEHITGSVGRDVRAQGRLLQAKICEDEGLFNRAAACWKDLLADAAEVPGGEARVLLAYGHCLASADPPNEDAAAVAWQRALELGGEPGQAAGLRLGDLLLGKSPAEPTKALSAWAQALRGIRAPLDYKNPYLAVAKARDMFERACRQFLEQRDFDRAQQTAETYEKLAVPGVGQERLARALEGQAQAWQAAAGATDTELLEKARGKFHRAGVSYEQAAVTGSQGDQLESWWRSAQCYLAAKDLAHAAAALERFVTNTQDEPRLAQAWFLLAETQAAQGHKDKARDAYHKCMEFPATAYAWRSRYQLAVEEIERKNFDHAKEILKQNLTAATPGMDRDAHEKSIYKMAGLLLQMRAYDEAIWYLKEAARQYPNHPSALKARDALADCYRILAEQTYAKIKELDAVKLEGMSPERKAALEEMKGHQQRTRRQWLAQAVAVHQGLADELRQKALSQPLSRDESIVSRRAVFGIADRNFDMNNFAEALRQYQRIQQEYYPKQIESLFACNGIWKCVGVMTETPDQARHVREAARDAIRLARLDLDAMPVEGDSFQGDGVWTKANWLAWINWVQAQLVPPATTPVARPNSLVN